MKGEKWFVTSANLADFLFLQAKVENGSDALFIVDQKRHRKRARRYRPLFKKMDSQPIEIKILRDGRLAQKIKVYKFYGFKGKYEE